MTRKRCCCCSMKTGIFVTGGVLGAIGIVLLAAWPSITDAIIGAVQPLSPGSFLYRQWAITPVPLYMYFMLWNWTNPDQIANPNVKPHFVEHGPYVFRDWKVKSNQIWDKTDDSVSYEDSRMWFFDEERSNGSLDDIITIPHFPSVMASKLSMNYRPSVRKTVNRVLNQNGGNLTMTATAIEILFNGFYDDLFDFVVKLNISGIPISSNHFAFFLGRNGSTGAEGRFTINTGQSDLLQLGSLMRWNGKTHTRFWEGECGKINGSTGELFPPKPKWENAASIFIPEFARYTNLFPQKVIDYRGIPVYLYQTTEQTFDNGYIAPDTKCFCVPGNGCPPIGATDFSSVAFGCPLYVSHPHFLYADPIYLSNTTGMQPDEKSHVGTLMIEPVMGAPIYANGQAQLNLLVEQNDDIDIFRDVAFKFYAPLLVLGVTAEITDPLFRVVKFAVNIPMIGQIIGGILTLIGIIMLAVAFWMTKTNRWDDKPNEEIPEDPKEMEAKENGTNSDIKEATSSPQKLRTISESSDLPSIRSEEEQKPDNTDADTRIVSTEEPKVIEGFASNDTTTSPTPQSSSLDKPHEQEATPSSSSTSFDANPIALSHEEKPVEITEKKTTEEIPIDTDTHDGPKIPS